MKNLAASVHARLGQRRAKTGEDFNVLLVRFALERLLYRLSRSRHREQFVLKGAMLFALWEPTLHRVTRDLDLLGFGNPSPVILSSVRPSVPWWHPLVSRWLVLSGSIPFTRSIFKLPFRIKLFSHITPR